MSLVTACVPSCRGLCDGPITRPEESYRMWCVCDFETTTMSKSRTAYGCRAMEKEKSDKRRLLLAVDSLIVLT